jgi:hypothetical protein
LRGVLFL